MVSVQVVADMQVASVAIFPTMSIAINVVITPIPAIPQMAADVMERLPHRVLPAEHFGNMRYQPYAMMKPVSMNAEKHIPVPDSVMLEAEPISRAGTTIIMTMKPIMPLNVITVESVEIQ